MSRRQLEKNGFSRLTTWEMKGDRIKTAEIIPSRPPSGGRLYAFVIGQKIKYVGLTERALRSRMDNYRDGKFDTEARVRDNIMNAIQSGKTVEIFGRFGIPFDELKSEERRMIDELKPDWNRT